MYLESLATALPPFSFSQSECLSIIDQSGAARRLAPRSRALLRKVLGGGGSGIETRHFCLSDPAELLERDAQALAEAFERESPPLAAAALEKALGKAGLAPADLDALFVCTCTGYLCPGVSSHLAERVGMDPSAYLQDLVGLGCGAAIPTMRSASNYLAAHPGARVATVAVEVCSAAFHLEDDPGVLISLCLFGDGAAAAVWSGEASPAKWRAGGFRTLHQPAHREKIRFVNSGGRLKNQLDKEVPALAARAVGELYGSRQAEPQRILAHSGGRDVIDALEAALPLPLPETRAVLKSCGNLSSPSVLFALERALEEPRDESRWWLTAFGAGFSAHCCELRRESGHAPAETTPATPLERSENPPPSDAEVFGGTRA